MICPFCDKSEVKLSFERRTRTFRKEDFELFEFFYKCDKCGEDFTTTEIDTLNTNQVYNQYREKYSIPFPVQLTAIREHYKLSSAKMSELLGFGPNQYRLYENGELPSGGNATLLSLIIHPRSFKEIVLKNRSVLSDKKLDEIIHRVDKKLQHNVNRQLKHILFPNAIIPDRFNGFTLPNFKKFANMVLYFLKVAQFKTKLNKLLFYADFANYKSTGFSISGCNYAAIDMGPVPDNFKMIYGLLEQENIFSTEMKMVYDREAEKFIPQQPFDASLFSEKEIEIMNIVRLKFGRCNANELIKISHEELAWLDNSSNNGIIDYSIYAPQLKAL